MACKPEDPDCGCVSEPVYTIQSNEAVERILFMLADSQVDFLEDGPLLCTDADRPGGCNYFYEICNPEALAGIDEIPEFPSVSVTFSGVIRNKYEQPEASLLITSYSNITINSIEKTN